MNTTRRTTQNPNSSARIKNISLRIRPLWDQRELISGTKTVQNEGLLPGCQQTHRQGLNLLRNSSVADDRVIIKILSLDSAPRLRYQYWFWFDLEKVMSFQEAWSNVCFRTTRSCPVSKELFYLLTGGSWTFHKVWDSIFYSSIK